MRRTHIPGPMPRALRAFTTFAFAIGVALIATPSAAQSLFGCSGLEAAAVPSIEGENGVFYQIDPDLMTSHRMSDEIVQQIAELSDAFEERGTRFVFVPLPTKALALPSTLGPEAVKFAYDSDLAATLYRDQVRRLSAARVAVVDAHVALSAGPRAIPSFFKTDPRLTNAGLNRLVDAVAETVGDWPTEFGPGYTTTQIGSTEVVSRTHMVLQLSCLSQLPEVAPDTYQTVAKRADDEMDKAPRIVFAGTEHTTSDDLNLDGFLQAASGEKATVLNGGEDALAALTAAVTSDAFRAEPPKVLIWAVPIWTNLALGGDQPMREALAAVEDRCVDDLDFEIMAPGRLRVAIGDAQFGPKDTLYLDNSAMGAKYASFRFVSPDGHSRTRVVNRSAADVTTGRFYMPFSALWTDGVSHVDIETPFSADAEPIIALCRGRAE